MVDRGGAPRRLGPRTFRSCPVARSPGRRATDGGSLRSAGRAARRVRRRLSRPHVSRTGRRDGRTGACLARPGLDGVVPARAGRTSRCGRERRRARSVRRGGSLAVQLARHFRAGTVIAVASTDEKRATALELGATTAVDPGPDGLSERILSANDGRRVDVVLDSIGGQRSLSRWRRWLRAAGSSVTGRPAAPPGEVSTRSLIIGSKSVVGFWLMDSLRDARASREPLRELFELLRAGTRTRSSRPSTRSAKRRAHSSTSQSDGRGEK